MWTTLSRHRTTSTTPKPQPALRYHPHLQCVKPHLHHPRHHLHSSYSGYRTSQSRCGNYNTQPTQHTSRTTHRNDTNHRPSHLHDSSGQCTRVQVPPGALCSYHQRFGHHARNCQPPCTWRTAQAVTHTPYQQENL
ncbi:hypothetical protein Pmani_005346 [Petrolisthes manimaculis]|uniref:Uncharacterized protein n=1 Tax=Petrolisthes manimaculis TaxID=1843537 RepID=A0AAE1QCE6_9EUCA|nr:hypothetical protein Pmani_005346 [Petrolisthes manimaculis]